MRESHPSIDAKGDPLFADLQRACAGRYELERRLGRGGMGIVFLARDLQLDRRVAIKLLPPAQAADPTARERFVREAQTAAQLSHPHITPVFAVHRLDEFVCFAMAYVEGETLGEHVRKRGSLPPVEGARVLSEVASALAYAHARGVVHRDVKPDNILLDAHTGRALVSDFGIARVGSGPATTGPREVVGTAEFMSPEQAAGGSVDPRSDLYSLGVVGYFVLSGTLPFKADNGYAVLVQHISRAPAPLASVAPTLPRRLAAAVDRCLEKDPGARFASAEAFAAAVDQAIAEYVYASPPLEVRAFLVESKHLSIVAWLYGLCAVVALPLLAGILRASTAGVATAAIAGIAIILLLPAAVTHVRVRRLRVARFGQRDLTDAIRAELDRRREELTFLYGPHPSPLERALRGMAYTGVAASGVATWAAIHAPTVLAQSSALGTFYALAGMTLLTAIAARVRTAHRRGLAGERRLRFWRGPIGRLFFRIGGIGVERPPSEPRVASALAPDLAVGVLGERFFKAPAEQT